jgi:flagellar hook protein FlgE
LQLLGFGVDENFGVNLSQLIPLTVPFGLEGAQATRDVHFYGVLAPHADIGHGTNTEFTVYDSEGTPVILNVSATLTAKSGDSTTYQWTASLNDSLATSGAEATVGAGEIVFDRNGYVIAGQVGSIIVARPESIPLIEAQLHFDQVSGLALQNSLGESRSVLTAAQQNGYPNGAIEDYIVTEAGLVRGLFDSGMERVLGQVPLASFPDPYGLLPRGDGLYVASAEAGPATIGAPSSGYLGGLVYVRDAPELEFGLDPYGSRFPWEMRTVHLDVQGQGYFVVVDGHGRRLFTRDGAFHLNVEQQLATRDGLLVLGYGVNDEFEVDQNRLVPLEVPFGLVVAAATQRATFVGVLTPQADIGDTPEIIELPVFGDATLLYPRDPDADVDEMSVEAAAATTDTRLVDVVVFDRGEFKRPFAEGELSFIGQRGGRRLDTKQLAITSTTTVGELIQFMDEVFGIDHAAPATSSGPAGGSIDDGRVRFVSNPGHENALEVGLSAFIITQNGEGAANPIGLRSTAVQSANGEGSTTDFIVFDDAGTPYRARLTTVLEAKDDETLTYRWFARSDDNQPALPSVMTALGTGTISFDANGEIQSGETATIAIDRDGSNLPPVALTLDLSRVAGLAITNSLGISVSSLNMLLQDGYPPGTLERFTVDDAGVITGFFDNGATRSLGQIALAAFRRPERLRAVGDGLYDDTHRSGSPRLGLPGSDDFGTLAVGDPQTGSSPRPWDRSDDPGTDRLRPPGHRGEELRRKPNIGFPLRPQQLLAAWWVMIAHNNDDQDRPERDGRHDFDASDTGRREAGLEDLCGTELLTLDAMVSEQYLRFSGRR